MKSIRSDELAPVLHFARFIDITPDYDYNGIIAYDARLLCVLSGNGAIEIAGSRYTLAPGTLICWQAGSEYGFCGITASPLRVIMLNFDFRSEISTPTKRIPDLPCDFDRSRIENTAFFTEDADRAGVYIDPEAFYAEPFMRELVTEYGTQQVYWESAASGTIAFLTARLARAMRLGSGRRRRCEEIIGYIGRHIDERLTYESLGKTFSYHPNHISRMIVQSTGMPLHRYLLRLRIERAYGMLADEGRSVAATARLCGFSDAPSFSKRFRKETGLTPSEVRRKSPPGE